MSYHYCTCDRAFDTTKGRHRARNGLTGYREVEVDDEGICVDCGHYAVATRHFLSPDNGDLRTFLMPRVIEEGDNHNKRERDRFTYRQRKQVG